MIGYLYVFEITYNVGFELRFNERGGRNGRLADLARTTNQYLYIVSNPTSQIVLRYLPQDEPIVGHVVYFPFVVSVQWFLYGCLFGLWRARRILQRHRFPKPSGEREASGEDGIESHLSLAN